MIFDQIPDVPLFESAALHIEAAAAIQLGRSSVQSYLPPGGADAGLHMARESSP